MLWSRSSLTLLLLGNEFLEELAVLELRHACKLAWDWLLAYLLWWCWSRRSIRSRQHILVLVVCKHISLCVVLVGPSICSREDWFIFFVQMRLSRGMTLLVLMQFFLNLRPVSIQLARALLVQLQVFVMRGRALVQKLLLHLLVLQVVEMRAVVCKTYLILACLEAMAAHARLLNRSVFNVALILTCRLIHRLVAGADLVSQLLVHFVDLPLILCLFLACWLVVPLIFNVKLVKSTLYRLKLRRERLLHELQRSVRVVGIAIA